MDEREELLAESITRQLGEGGGMWAPCSGCHESVDGYSVSPIDPVFKCYLGSGCHECGGIGAIWDTTDYDHMARSIMEADAKSAAPGGGRHAQSPWQPVKVTPDIGRKFICLWNDWSGSVMYWRHDHGYIDQDGDELSRVDWSKIECWSYLPDGFEFWCEHGDEGMVLTTVSAHPSTDGNTTTGGVA